MVVVVMVVGTYFSLFDELDAIVVLGENARRLGVGEKCEECGVDDVDCDCTEAWCPRRDRARWARYSLF